MATNDLISQLEATVTVLDISGDGEDFTTALDTQNYDSGFVFAAVTLVYAAGQSVLTLQESSDPNGVGDPWTDVAEEKYIAFTSVTMDSIYLGGPLEGLGAISTKRYVRVKSVSTGSPNSVIVVGQLGAREVTPTIYKKP